MSHQKGPVAGRLMASHQFPATSPQGISLDTSRPATNVPLEILSNLEFPTSAGWTGPPLWPVCAALTRWLSRWPVFSRVFWQKAVKKKINNYLWFLGFKRGVTRVVPHWIIWKLIMISAKIWKESREFILDFNQKSFFFINWQILLCT